MFFEKGRSKIANQKVSNKAANVFRELQFDWSYAPLSNDGLRMKLKECFFKFPTAAGSSYVTGASRVRKQMARIATTKLTLPPIKPVDAVEDEEDTDNHNP